MLARPRGFTQWTDSIEGPHVRRLLAWSGPVAAVQSYASLFPGAGAPRTYAQEKVCREIFNKSNP